MVTLNNPLKEQLTKNGYLVAKGLLDDHLDLKPVRLEYKKVLDDLAYQWYSQKKDRFYLRRSDTWQTIVQHFE